MYTVKYGYRASGPRRGLRRGAITDPPRLPDNYMIPRSQQTLLGPPRGIIMVAAKVAASFGAALRLGHLSTPWFTIVAGCVERSTTDDAARRALCTESANQRECGPAADGHNYRRPRRQS